MDSRMMTVDMMIFNTTTWIFFSETCFFILQLNGSEEFITAIAVCWNRLLSANFYSSVNVNTVKRVGASLVEQWLWNGPPVQGTRVDPFWGTESPCVKGQRSAKNHMSELGSGLPSPQIKPLDETKALANSLTATSWETHIKYAQVP